MLLDDLKSIVGAEGWRTDAESLAPHLSEGRGKVFGRTPIMVMPRTTAEVAAVVRTCAAAGAPIVPQGGNTGLCGGAIPDQSGTQILLSLTRLNRIRDIDSANLSMIAEAGCILATVQDVARDAGMWFPLSFGSEGSCQIGGNLATNAGGINVLRFGTARQQVLGLEVVLADGSIWDGLRTLRKDTGGYDLKQLFIGSEGTLGIITAASLRLQPQISYTHTAMVALPAAQAATNLLRCLQTSLAEQLHAFELIADTALQLALQYETGLRPPFSQPYPWVALLESASVAPDSELPELLGAALESGQILDAVVAKNSAEAEQLWRVRHAIPWAQRAAGASLKHDIAVPIGRVAEFLQRAAELVDSSAPGARIVAFGHVGDGNLHYNISQPVDASAEQFQQQGGALSEAVYELVAELGGSFSAEHGVGIIKKAYLQRFRSATEIELMRRLKGALDPANMLNPGKVI